MASQSPDAEDINKDYNLDQSENYNQYNISLLPSDLVVGRNNIVRERSYSARFQNGPNL